MKQAANADANVTLPRKKRSVLWWIGGMAFLLGLIFFYQLFGPNPPIVVSKKTTYITAPLKANGLPDYARYFLDKSRDGITPENNAAVALWQVLWPEDIDPKHHALIRAELGLQGMPAMMTDLPICIAIRIVVTSSPGFTSANGRKTAATLSPTPQ